MRASLEPDAHTLDESNESIQAAMQEIRLDEPAAEFVQNEWTYTGSAELGLDED